VKEMFRTKTTTRRNVKRAISPLQMATNAQPAADPTPAVTLPETSSFEKNLTNFFEAESSASSNTKPWLRLERGIRLQKLRVFAEEQTEYTAEERDALIKMLIKANDAKVLNTKQQIQYENGKILSIRGLRKDDEGVFKIDVSRPSKKKSDEGIKNE
jgi:hypothetical protein